MKTVNEFFFVLLIFISISMTAQSFKVIPLGVKGGLDESNLSAYMVAPFNSNNYICLDAGTLYYGLNKAIKNNLFSKSAEKVLKENIKGYLISHAHLDHVAGLIINAPADNKKTIYSSNYTINVFKNNYFTWQNWANFADQGEKPRMDIYHYQVLTLNKEIALKNTNLFVTPFELSHANPYKSLAFLVRYKQNYLLYLGDTGADEIEKSKDLEKLWIAIAPLIKSNQLKAMFIETSFPNSQPDDKLFGHLTPKWFFKEMHQLSLYTSKKALENLNVIITHRKPHKDNETLIQQELENNNTLNLHLIFPKQARLLTF